MRFCHKTIITGSLVSAGENKEPAYSRSMAKTLISGRALKEIALFLQSVEGFEKKLSKLPGKRFPEIRRTEALG